MNGDIVIMPVTKIKKKCLCCGKEMEIEPYIEQDFCDRCFVIVCQEFFNKENDNLTIKELREKVGKIIENGETL
jgi:hypothetical protein